MARTAQVYARTALPVIELPLLIQYLESESKRKGSRITAPLVRQAKALYEKKQYGPLYELMWQERTFRQQLLDGKALPGDSPQYAQWEAARAAFSPVEPKPFTSRWAMSYEPGAGLQPVQALTSTFLHGSTAHLIGNMVFLFLFGFTLEMALGPFVYLAFYLLCGFGASLFAGLFYDNMGGFGLGASGAIAGLMAMYAVMYRMRRIRFFYMLAFYFNYAVWPALVVLPVWMAFELAQHFIGGREVAYMAHFGGLLVGAITMWLYMRVKAVETPVDEEGEKKKAALAQQEAVNQAIRHAQKHTHALDFNQATKAWRHAAKLAPGHLKILRSWFESARHAPASEDFHAAARSIFKLPGHTDAERQLQHHAWRSYCERAQPVPRITESTMHALARNFVRQGELADAQKLCRMLEGSATHPQWAGTLTMLVNGMAKTGKLEDARAWLPALQRDAPQEAITRWLAMQQPAA
ncbi:rhomboid family protein [Diaphorobacter aerolatus]|uniref:rhomboid family protein n=1 Tax=Diaphorobacter aerolatus TaxID=1288495 RepID=UPI001D014DFF|nr:rhomboid family intramembrane serine protease [Diaphorobacter aerolatus]